MVLLGRQDLGQTFVDDQSPTLWNRFVGDWVGYTGQNKSKYWDGTFTATATPGSSFSFTFSGFALYLYGGVSNTTVSSDGGYISYPTADYVVDGHHVGNQQPYLSEYGNVIYLTLNNLDNGTHTVNLTVTATDSTNLFIIDCYEAFTYVNGSNYGASTSLTPSSTSTSTPNPHPTNVGVIVGTVVGGITGVSVLIFVLYCFLRRSRAEQPYYFGESRPTGNFVEEYRAEPFDPSVTSHAGPVSSSLTGSNLQSEYTVGGPNRIANPSL